MVSFPPFAKEFTHFCERAWFHTLTFGDQHDRLAVCVCRSGSLSNSKFSNLFSQLFIGDCFAVAVFCALEVHQIRVVSLLPFPRRFFPDVTMLIRDNMTPS